MGSKASKTNKCGKKKGLMLAYGLIQLGTRVISALALTAIACGFYSLKQEAKVFTDCVEEATEIGKTTLEGVRFCNGGN